MVTQVMHDSVADRQGRAAGVDLTGMVLWEIAGETVTDAASASAVGHPLVL